MCACVRASERARDAATEGDPQLLTTITTFSLAASSVVIPFVIMSAFGSHSSLVGIATTLLAARSGADIPVG